MDRQKASQLAHVQRRPAKLFDLSPRKERRGELWGEIKHRGRYAFWGSALPWVLGIPLPVNL